jgi:pyruvate dehydrogenase E1 component alpha subunit
MSDPELYRTKDEVEQWRARDPIATFVVRLREQGLLTDADLATISAAVDAEIASAVEFAEAGPREPVDDLLKDVYTS